MPQMRAVSESQASSYTQVTNRLHHPDGVHDSPMWVTRLCEDPNSDLHKVMNPVRVGIRGGIFPSAVRTQPE